MTKDDKLKFPKAIVGANLEVLQMNTAFQDFFQNQEGQDVHAINLAHLFEVEHLDRLKQSIDKVRAGKKLKEVFEIKAKKGRYIKPVVVSITQVDDAQHKWSNAVVLLTCEEKKQVSINSFVPNLILENSPLKIFVIDTNYELIYFNQKAAVFINDVFEHELTLGENIFFKEQEKDEWRNYFEVVFQGESLILEKNYQIGRKEYYNLITLAPLKNEEGEVIGCIFYGKDILDLKKMEGVLFGREQENNHLFENNILGIALLDKNLELISANEAFCRLTGLKKNELVGFKLIDFLGNTNVSFENKIQEINAGKIPVFSFYTNVLLKKEKRVYLRVEVKVVFYDKENTGYVLTLLNVSKQKEARRKDQEIIELKYKEKLIIEQQQELQAELDARIRELASNWMLVSQKTSLLKSVGKKLKEALPNMKSSSKKDVEKVIKIIERQGIFEDNWENLKIHFVKTHPQFFNRIRAYAPAVTENDLRHCVYLKIGLSTKETAQILAVLPKTVEMARYRIKKKLKLDRNQKLSDFIRNI